MGYMHRIGTTVRIKKTSGYANQITAANNAPGIVVEHRRYWHRVNFPNGYSNSYEYDDLEEASPIFNNTEAAKYFLSPSKRTFNT